MNDSTILDEISAFGHKNILCTHKSTIEITKSENLTLKGNCVLGVKASKACFDLNPKLKKSIQNSEKISACIKMEDSEVFFYGYGHPKLMLMDKNDIVFRTSSYLCDRTILINCSISSVDLERELVEKLRDPKKKFTITFRLASS